MPNTFADSRDRWLQMSANFKRARRADVQDLLETLTDMGLIRHVGETRFK